jgi:ubiquitin carboxyl-terminal hydrolase 5/13
MDLEETFPLTFFCRNLQNYAFDAITESGSKLVSVSGPGLQGLVNLGNSCYCNSVVQVLGALPKFAKRYGTDPNSSVKKHRLFENITPSGAPNNLMVQTSKLISALTSGAYAIPKEELEEHGTLAPKYRVAPRMFKRLIGKDHADFKTNQQQDAEQFLQYMLEQLDRAEAKYDRNMTPSSYMFSFQTEARIVSTTDQKIKYKDSAAEVIWSLALPMDKAMVLPKPEEPEHKKQKQEDRDEKQVPTLAFQHCVDTWAAETVLDDYRWPHLQNTVHPAMTKTRFKNFPRYLWVQIRRYKIGSDWQPVKLEVNLDIPEMIDLNKYKTKGPQDGEELVPEESDGAAAIVTGPPAHPEISEAALGQLMDMGFQMNGCKRALMKVGGSDTEAAMNWIFEHNMDPDFNDPLPEPGSEAPNGGALLNGVDDALVMSLVESLGCFTIDQVRAALQETRGAADRAADWLFSHMDDLDGAIANLQSPGSNHDGASSAPQVPLEDGDGKYTMVGIVSHIGKNTGSGHYVAHIKKDGKWVIFNDEKVALSENPPIQHAYLYCFQRADTIGSLSPNY